MGTVVEIHGRNVEFPDSLQGHALNAAIATAARQMGREGGIGRATAFRSVMQGLGDVVQGGAQLLTHALPTGAVNAVNSATETVNNLPVVGPITRGLGMVPATPAQIDQGVNQREANYQGSRGPGAGMDWWRAAGQVPTGLALGGGGGATLAGAAAGGAAAGAAQGALSPVVDAPDGGYWGAKGQQALIGGGAGAVGGAAGHLLGRAIAPQVDPNVRILRNAGVDDLTLGQIAGGATRRMEDKAVSIPIVGDRIAGAQRNSIDSFNRAVANRALQPLGQTVPRDAQVGRALVEDVETRIQGAYSAAFSRARPFGPDARFAQDIATVGHQFRTPDMNARFARELQDRIVSRLQSGPIDGATFKTIDTELGGLARQWRSAPDPAHQELGAAYASVQQAMRDLLARSNPAVAPQVRRADAAWARFVRMQDAGTRSGDTAFTPAQMSAAVRNNDRSVRHGAFARGDALMQELSDAGRAVLPSTVPNSGTADRALLALLAGGTATGFVSPYALAAGGAAYGAYTRPGQNALTRLLTRQAGPAASFAGDAIAGAGAPVAVPLGSLLLSPR